MKIKLNSHTLLFIFLMLLTAGTPSATSESTGNLIVDISGFSNSEGFVMVALHNSEESYQSGEKGAVAKTKTRVVDRQAQIVFANLPYGPYSVSFYHDENANGELDKNAMGIPTEAYGFSNNAKGFFGRPGYDEVVIQLDSTKKRITVKLD